MQSKKQLYTGKPIITGFKQRNLHCDGKIQLTILSLHGLNFAIALLLKFLFIESQIQQK